jgi:hypothetical protein
MIQSFIFSIRAVIVVVVLVLFPPIYSFLIQLEWFCRWYSCLHAMDSWFSGCTFWRFVVVVVVVVITVVAVYCCFLACIAFFVFNHGIIRQADHGCLSPPPLPVDVAAAAAAVAVAVAVAVAIQ